MASLNKVLLIGNLTRDPELRYIPSGTAVASFTLAVSRVYVNQTGEKKEQTAFIRIVVWGRRAEVCAEYLTKGSPVFVEGRLQSRDWETQDGQKRNTSEVVADNVQFLRGGQKTDGASKQQQASAGKAAPEEIDTINLNDEAAAPLDETRQQGQAKSSAAPEEEVPF